MKNEKIVFMFSVSMLSLSAVAFNNASEKQIVKPENLEFAFNGQSATETRTEVESITVVGMKYDKSRKAFIPFDVNKYFGKFSLRIIRDSNGNMYHQYNADYYKIVRNAYKTYGGMNVSGYRYMCDTYWYLYFFNL